MRNIKQLRMAKGISQTQFAATLKTTQSAVAMWEAGTRSPVADKLPEIAKALDCTIDALFSAEEKEAEYHGRLEKYAEGCGPHAG